MTPARIALVVLSWLCAASASAQIHKHDVRLFLDTDLVSYHRTTYETAEVKDIESAFDVGPGGSSLTSELPGHVGFGVGYAFRPRFIGQLHLSFARHQAIHERFFDGAVQPSLEEPVVTTFMLRPELEFAINPASRAVVAVLVGFDVRRLRVLDDKSDPRFERILFGLGPVAGLVTHLFVVKDASLDLGVVAAVNFLTAEGDGLFTDAQTLRQASVNLMLGLSLWP